MFDHHRLVIFLVLSCVLIFKSTIVSSSVIHHPKQSNDEKLKLVFLFHRHGERTPYMLYPNDPYKRNITETVGIGQLINKGKQRLYRLGEYLSKRYYNKCGDRFPIEQKSPRKVYVRSSGSERCLQSVSLLLAGMFPPEGEWKWNQNLGSLWQPFAIQTVPFDHDTLLNPDYKCPVAEHVLDQIYHSEEAQNIQRKYQNLLHKVANWTGYKPEEMNIVNASYIYDVLLSEHNFGLPYPEWLDNNIWNDLKNINNEVFRFNSSNRKIQRFRCGSMFGEIYRQLKAHFGNDSQSNDNHHQIYIYSTHDEWLAQFLSSMQVYNGIPPFFGSTIMLEVYQEPQNNGEPYFKGFYLNSTETGHAYPLQFPSCNEPCTLTKFHESIKDLMIEDPKILEHECYVDIQKYL
ncbi:hypothetical protein HUG17_8464 [Dermatophagoides farinae]|uniref:Uncharacterized protein n=1 Tax=Dermatophagoides farinae TaxID=6954 RepID=A0A9D4NXB4_DERFA|nr:prostatic acid phosphatase-like [Dermatophagoides farinae]KAH7640995.1 hypothetical protein HUG17_8464 [Dermatophagoides farinae]